MPDPDDEPTGDEAMRAFARAVFGRDTDTANDDTPDRPDHKPAAGLFAQLTEGESS